MKILFISSQYPHAQTKAGGSKRLYQLAKDLAAKHEIHLVAMDGCDEGLQGTLERDFFASVRLLSLNAFSGWRGYALPGIAPKIPTDELNALSHWLGNQQFDVVWMAYSQSLWFADWPPLQAIPRRVYMEDDLRLRDFPQKLTPKQRFRKWQLHRYYGNKFAKVQAVICINELEKKVMQAFFPNMAIFVVGYGLDLSQYPIQSTKAREPRVAGFIGNYKHIPNAEALRWLCEDVMPVMRQAHPQIQWVLAGVHIPSWVHTLAKSDASMTLMENVEPLSAFYQAIDIFVSPIQTGGGLRTKLIEAAAFGVPIVSTALGAQGLESMRIALAQTPHDFAARWGLYTQSPPHGRDDAAYNRHLIETTYSNQAQSRLLESVLMADGTMQTH
jgi:glycosyltransferase involved in cell wall biosynthesis